MDLSAFFNWLPQVPFVPFATALLSAALLSFWKPVSEWLGIAEYRWVVGWVFIASAVLVLSQVCHQLWNVVHGKYAARCKATELSRRLRSLTKYESAVLRGFVDTQSRTLEQDPRRQGIASLLQDKIISGPLPPPERFSDTGYRKYLIDEAVWEHLAQYPELVANPSKQPGPD